MRDKDMRKSITVSLGFIVQSTDDSRAEGRPLEVLDADGDRLCFANDLDDAKHKVTNFVQEAMTTFTFVVSLD